MTPEGIRAELRELRKADARAELLAAHERTHAAGRHPRAVCAEPARAETTKPKRRKPIDAQAETPGSFAPHWLDEDQVQANRERLAREAVER